MGPYCKFCDRRCFVPRVLANGQSIIMATCRLGMAHDEEVTGQTHEAARNPILEPEPRPGEMEALVAADVAAREAFTRQPQAERPHRLRYQKGGIHDHHRAAAKTGVERTAAEQIPWLCYADERCWWDGGASL